MNTLYLEPFGGMAGDMLLAALLDLKDERFRLVDLERLSEALVPGEASLALEEARRGALRGLNLRVRTPESERAPQRHLSDLLAAIDRAPLGEAARLRAAGCLRRIAVAEAEVHGSDPEAVHFHEVGAVDTLIDVCGAALALERLAVGRVLASPPLVGSGTITCAHGEMPVPAPGTAGIMRGLPLILGGGGERLTPTGAALLAEMVDAFEPPGAFESVAIGYGAGARDPRDEPPNLMRVQLGLQVDDGAAGGTGAARRSAWCLACNLDDTTGEEVGFLVQELRAAGALEVWSEPVQMKKDRPGVVVSALCRAQVRDALERVCFACSPTLGVRWSRLERTECERETLAVEIDGQEVRVKLRRRPQVVTPTALDLSPEHDDLARIARASGVALRELERRAIDAALRQLG